MIENSIHIGKTSLQIAEQVAEEILRMSLEAANSQKKFHISLSGGSTPALLFNLLAKEKYVENIQWEFLHFWWGDERMVPHSDSQSNYGEAYRSLFSHPAIPPKNIHPVATDLAQEDAAFDYQLQMKTHIESENGIPSFDWMILGMGTDGHTASLFPNKLTEHLAETAWTEFVNHPESDQLRLSLSAKVICNSKRVSYLVTGEAKAPLLKAIINNSAEAQAWPAHYMCALNHKREWFLDTAAATLLEKEK